MQKQVTILLLSPNFLDHFECVKSAVKFLVCVCVSYHDNEEVEDTHPAQFGFDQGHQVLKNRCRVVHCYCKAKFQTIKLALANLSHCSTRLNQALPKNCLRSINFLPAVMIF